MRGARSAPSLAALLALAALAAACSSADAPRGHEIATEEDGLTRLRPVFAQYAAQGGTAAGWFDPARNAVFSLALDGSRTQWIERRWDAPSSSWVETARATTTGGPTLSEGLRDHRLAFDTARHRLLVIERGQLWAWTGGLWSRVPTAHKPPERGFFATAWDSARQRVVLFGGVTGQLEIYRQDTWEFDGVDWAQVATSGPARWGHAMAYDPLRRRVVMFGGFTAEGPSARDTWEWDGDLAKWTALTTTGPDPDIDKSTLRVGTVLTWDADRKKVVFFGRRTSWEWDGAAWSQRALPPTWPGLAMPSGLAAYDAPRHTMILWSLDRGTMALGYASGPDTRPVLDGVPSQNVYAGEVVAFQLHAQDADGDPLTYSATPLPRGAQLKTSDGFFRWTPGFDQIGPAPMTFAATDGAGSDTRAATLTVIEPDFTGWLPRGPVASLRATTTVSVMQEDSTPTGGASRVGEIKTASVSCTVSGDNPTALTVTCDVSGTYLRKPRPTDGYDTRAFAFQASSRVEGRARFFGSYVSSGDSGDVIGTLRRSPSGQLELVIETLRFSISGRFGIGFPGHSTLRSLGWGSSPFGP